MVCRTGMSGGSLPIIESQSESQIHFESGTKEEREKLAVAEVAPGISNVLEHMGTWKWAPNEKEFPGFLPTLQLSRFLRSQPSQQQDNPSQAIQKLSREETAVLVVWGRAQ